MQIFQKQLLFSDSGLKAQIVQYAALLMNKKGFVSPFIANTRPRWPSCYDLCSHHYIIFNTDYILCTNSLIMVNHLACSVACWVAYEHIGEVSKLNVQLGQCINATRKLAGGTAWR